MTGSDALSVYYLLHQPLKCFFKSFIIFLGPLAGPFQMVFPGASPGFFIEVPFHEQAVDIRLGVVFAALVDGVGAFAEGHGCDAVVLGDDDVAGAAEGDQGEVHGVRAGADDLDGAVVRGEDVVLVAQEGDGQVVFAGDALHNAGDGAGIGVDEDGHGSLLLSFFVGLTESASFILDCNGKIKERQDGLYFWLGIL